jgi:hypothetical protein
MAISLKTLPEVSLMKDNILRVLDDASDYAVAEGVRWYDDAFALADYLARDTTYARWQTAGLIAVISPRLHWNLNTLYPFIIMDLHATGQREVASWPSMCVTHPGREKAFRVLDGDISPVMNGVKVEHFYRSIMGETEAVAVDTWASRIALGDPSYGGGVSKSVYPYFKEAYCQAGEGAGFEPCVAQAISWCEYRAKKNLPTSLTEAAEVDKVAA